MELLVFLPKIIFSFLLLGFIAIMAHLFDAFILKPKRLRLKLQNQGIQGPPSSFFVGNLWDIIKTRSKDSKLPQSGEQVISHNCASAVFPYMVQWSKQYGRTFVFSLGNLQILFMNDPNVLKDLATNTSVDLGRPFYHEIDPLFGQGISASDGEVWARQRKILAPEFFMDKVKGMTKLMIDSALMVVNSLNGKIESGGGVAELNIEDYTRSFAGDVILRACFGTNYAEGNEIFFKLRALQEILAKNLFHRAIPGMRYLPTKSNREIWRLEKESRAMILEVVKERKEATLPPGKDKDLLQIIIESAERSDLGQSTESFVVDNCKNIYFAGYDTTAVSAAWTLMLLALYPEWQDKVRAEILENYGGHELLDVDVLRKMKTLTMVINESLRLYSPAPIVPREALEDLSFGGINVPKGVNIWIVQVTLHQDPDLWGPDADKFNPQRFSNGVSGACKVPNAFIPFGAGPHTCLGQHLAMAELRIFLTFMLSNYTFSLSPKYRHSPFMNLVVEPEYGIDLIVRRL